MPFAEAAASRERPSSTRAIAKRRRTHPPSLVLAARHHPKITRRKLKPRNLNRLAHGQISCASCQGSHRIEQQAIREGAESQALWALVLVTRLACLAGTSLLRRFAPRNDRCVGYPGGTNGV